MPTGNHTSDRLIMKISTIELEELYTKVFEGLGFYTADATDCAEAICWLEKHGIPIIEQIHQSIQNKALPKSCPSEFQLHNDRLAIVDAHKNGGFIYGGLAADIAYLNALHKGSFSVQVNRPSYPSLIFPNIVNCGNLGVHAAAHWHEDGLEHLITMKAGADYPHYSIYRPDKGTRPTDQPQLSIHCATDLKPIEQLTKRLSKNELVDSMAPTDFTKQNIYQSEHGVDMEPAVWDELNLLSKAILVEA